MSVILGRFVTKRRRYILFFLLISFGCSRYNAINQEKEKLDSRIHQTAQILHALHLEEIGKFNQSQQLWSQFIKRSKKAKEHHFKASLVLYSPHESSEEFQPESKPSKYLLSYFYTWQKQWKKALGVLPSRNKKSELNHKAFFQRTNILLALGRYEEVQYLLQNNKFQSFDLTFQQTLLWGKYYILTDQVAKAMKIVRVLEEEYLYLPVINLFPVDYILKEKDYVAYLEQSLLRFPSSLETVEALAKYYLDQKKWGELESLLTSRSYYDSKNKYWIFYGELYLATKRYNKLKEHLQTYKGWKGDSQPYLDLQARMLILKQEWKKLKVVALNLIKLYPELIDGKLFLAEYYRFTGDTTAREKLLQAMSE